MKHGWGEHVRWTGYILAGEGVSAREERRGSRDLSHRHTQKAGVSLSAREQRVALTNDTPELRECGSLVCGLFGQNLG